MTRPTPTPVCFANHLSPSKGERKGARLADGLSSPPSIGERWRAKRDGAGVDFTRDRSPFLRTQKN